MLLMMLIKRKCLILVSIVEKPTTLKKICSKWRRELAKTKKKSSTKQEVSLYAYYVEPGKSSSFVEWIMDYGSSNHMSGITSLFSSYDTQKHTS